MAFEIPSITTILFSVIFSVSCYFSVYESHTLTLNVPAFIFSSGKDEVNPISPFYSQGNKGQQDKEKDFSKVKRACIVP